MVGHADFFPFISIRGTEEVVEILDNMSRGTSAGEGEEFDDNASNASSTMTVVSPKAKACLARKLKNVKGKIKYVGTNLR